jgi:hypothetical protein
VAVVLKVSYGVDVLDDNDPYIQIADDAMHATGNGGVPANSIVDIFPPGELLAVIPVKRWGAADHRSASSAQLAHPRLAAEVREGMGLGYPETARCPV